MNNTYYKNTNPINRFFLNNMLNSPKVKWITVSEQGKQQLLQFPVKPKNEVSVIPPYIPVRYSSYAPLKMEMVNYISSHKKNIAFYGHSFMCHNGVDIYGFKTAIKAYSEVLSSTTVKVGFVLCLAEDHDINKVTQLKDYAKELGVINNIFWQIGAIDNIQTLWHEADIYLRPTSTDGDSVAVREALDEGMIVIASDVCYRPDGVQIYEYGNDSQLVDLIIKNLDKPRSEAKPNYQYYNEMKQIYLNILNEKK